MSFTSKGMRRLACIIACISVMPFGVQSKAPDNAVRRIDRNSRDNSPKFIQFNTEAGVSNKQAQQIFEKYMPMNKVTDAMKKCSATETKLGVLTERYDQYFKGIKVERANFAIISKEGVVQYIMGNYYKTNGELPVQYGITEATAFNNALEKVGAKKYMWQDAAMEANIKAEYHKPDTSYLPAAKRVWIEDLSTTDHRDGSLHLAYAFDIYAMEPLSRNVVYVDANTGKILSMNPLIKHTAATSVSLYSGTVPMQTAFNGGTYKLYDSTRGNGVHTLNLHNGTNYGSATEYTSAANTWLTSDAAYDAHWGAEMVYDYWKNEQGRLSYDNLNSILNSYVHYSNNYNNAFWDGTRMTYGDGSGIAGGGFSPLTSLDVTAHEIGHGVCEYTAGLDYELESGAMNEGFSDIWGAVIENYANPHEIDAVAKNTWTMGEEIGATPLRSMQDPTLYNDPDTYGGPNWVNQVGCVPGGGNDQCGVHTNSGVLNHWFYLLCQGGSGTNGVGNAFSLTGIGILKGADIVYQTELSLTNTSNYADCRVASIQAASVLYGSCSAEVEAVTRAWYAVNVGSDWTPCQPYLGFATDTVRVNEWANSSSCIAGIPINIPVAVIGLAATGGNPVVKATQTGGSAVLGVDYKFNIDSATFTAGVIPDTHYVTITYFDNGAINDDKDIELTLTLNAHGSNAALLATATTVHVMITNDDMPPSNGATASHDVNTMTATSNLTSPFYSAANMAHSQFLLTAAELTAAGMVPNMPISSLAFNVTTKNSTQPFNGYTVSLANTTQADLSANFVTAGLTQVYNGNLSTTMGWTTIPFTTTYNWDGTSNLVVNVCFTNTSNDGANDQVDGYTSGDDITARAFSNAAGTGCGLAFNASQVHTTKPVMRFEQTTLPTAIETVASNSRNWNVRPGTEVYFYSSADRELIASIKDQTDSLGCVDAEVTAQGNGFNAFGAFAPVNRSKKEFSMTPTVGANANYTATFFMTTTELAGANTASLLIVKTNAATDADINNGNTVVVTPTVLPFTDFNGFSGAFTGFSRFFLIDGPITLPAASVNDVNSIANTVRIDNNPFSNTIGITYTGLASTKATIRLYDMTGRVLLTEETVLSSHHNIDCSKLALAQGHYTLQIITPAGVMNKKMLKN